MSKSNKPKTKKCIHCGLKFSYDANNHPTSSDTCLKCYNKKNKKNEKVKRKSSFVFSICGYSLNDDEIHHTSDHRLCFDCFLMVTGKSRTKSFGGSKFRNYGRYCIICGQNLKDDTIDHPSTHDLCYDCYLEFRK